MGGGGRKDQAERRLALATGEEAEALALDRWNNAGAGSRGQVGAVALGGSRAAR
jgi:hypothetical protein